MKKIEAYYCDFCGGGTENADEVLAHEKECDYNPSVKACLSCGNLDEMMYCKIFKTVMIKIRTLCKDWKSVR